MKGFIWLALLVIFLIVEACTVGLTAIWMAVGSLAAFLAQQAGAGTMFQITVFFVVSVILMAFTKPFVQKYVNSKLTRTNYEEVIGKKVKVTEKIDNINDTGAAVYKGLEWTARAKNDAQIIEEGSIVVVVEIAGVKLIVERP